MHIIEAAAATHIPSFSSFAVPRAGKETLLHLSFYARAQKLKATDPTPSVTVCFTDLQVSAAKRSQNSHNAQATQPL